MTCFTTLYSATRSNIYLTTVDKIGNAVAKAGGGMGKTAAKELVQKSIKEHKARIVSWHARDFGLLHN